MATLMTIEGTIDQGLLVRDALCANYKYQAEIDDGEGNLIPNPENATVLSRRMITEFIINNVKSYRANLFEEGRTTAVTAAEAEVDGVATS